MTRIFLRLAASAALAGGLAASASALQEEDPNARTPIILAMDVETESGEVARVEYVGGDDGWANVLATLVQLRQPEAEANPEIAAQLWERRDINAPIFLFEYARMTVDTDPERAIYAYLLGRTRAAYDVRRCLDSSAAQTYQLASSFAGDGVTQAMLDDVPRLISVMREVLAADDLYAGTASPWWICSTANSSYAAAQNGATLAGSEWLKVESRWPALREEGLVRLRAEIDLLVAAEAQSED